MHHIDKPLELYKTTEKDSLGFDSCRNLLGDEISAHTVILHINGRPCPLLKSVIIHCKTRSARAKLAIIKNLLPNLLFISSLISFIQVSGGSGGHLPDWHPDYQQDLPTAFVSGHSANFGQVVIVCRMFGP